jgi:hypothetical protein
MSDGETTGMLDITLLVEPSSTKTKPTGSSNPGLAVSGGCGEDP